MPTPVIIDRIRAMHAHGETLHGYCYRCDRWADIDLAALIAVGQGERKRQFPCADIRARRRPITAGRGAPLRCCQGRLHSVCMETEVAYRVVIECPTTGREVDTGLSMSRSAFEHPAVRHSAVACPYCRQRHEFHIWDAWLRIDD